MIKISINVTKIDKTAIVPGKNGKYMDLVLWENKAGEDQYGNHGFVTQDLGKARREAGERGAILGNWKDSERTKPQPLDDHNASKANGYQPEAGDDEVPF